LQSNKFTKNIWFQPDFCSANQPSFLQVLGIPATLTICPTFYLCDSFFRNFVIFIQIISVPDKFDIFSEHF
jgi:hypothetical protein